MYILGIDLGGTKVAMALMSTEEKIIEKRKIATDLTISPQKMIERISDEAKNMLRNNHLSTEDLQGVGLGAPGPLDTKKGCITQPPNLTGWINVPIVQLLEEHLKTPVRLENDANAAALAEKQSGAGKGLADFVYVTISTGIGAGIIANNTLISGQKGNAGDFGHTVVDPSFGRCVCGQKGCIEYIASGTAISREGSKLLGKNLTTQQVFELYQAKDPIITPYIQRVFEALGAAVVTLINTFDPEAIILGGGVTQVGDTLFDAINHYVNRYTLNPDARHTPILRAQLNQDAGVIGACQLALTQLNRMKLN